MAINRLYPPNIAGTIPSFYTTNTGTSLEVPFSMNITVSNTAVSGMRLRLKTSSTNIVLANLFSQKYGDDSTNRSVIYELTDDVVSKLIVGNFYKVQLAYVDQSGNDGYYSTVAIVKYTAKPQVQIAGLNMISATTISDSKLIGYYTNEDQSEKVYQYRFILSDSKNKEIQNTGWLIHNTQSDSSLYESQDEFLSSVNINEGEIYKIQYQIITNNGLKLSTTNYEIIKGAASGSELYVTIGAEMDYDNARVKISIRPQLKHMLENKLDEYALIGSFRLSRKDYTKAGSLWETIGEVSLNTVITANNPYIMMDYTIESGASYIYSFQKFNSKNIFSKRVEMVIPIKVYFEDAFLYDGNKQLKIRFNPAISSFKSVVAETKKTTLGRKYPFILRNGVLNYKEFPINGLISYQMDNDELFISKKDLELQWRDPSSFTDITDENLNYERKFKLAVLDWLNNGEIKLFKSPQEGTYIVRLTNVSLAPNTQLGRMLHTFSCTASEVSDFDVSALNNYSLLSQEQEGSRIETTRIIDLSSLYNSLGENAKEKIKTYDLTEGTPCRKVEFKYALSSYDSGTEQILKNSVYGYTFTWGEYNFAIDKSGTYTVELDEYSTSPLIFTTDVSTISLYGYVILTIEKLETDNLDSVQETLSMNLCGLSLYGLEENIEKYTWTDNNKEEHEGYYTRNIFEGYDNLKLKLSDIQYISYQQVPIYYGSSSMDIAGNWKVAIKDVSTLPAQVVCGESIIIRMPTDKGYEYYKYIPKPEHFIQVPDATGTLQYPEPQNNWFDKLQHYGTKVLFGNIERDINELVGGSADDIQIDMKRTIPIDEHGNISLRIQQGVQVYVYGNVSIQKYGLEDYDPVNQFSKQELDAYENYKAMAFNFKKTSFSDVGDTDYLYIMDKRQFVQISYNQAQDYENGGYNLYIPNYPNTYTDGEIETARKEWVAETANLNEVLKNNLS